MTYIIFEQAAKVFILKSTDVEALLRAQDLSAACRAVSVHAELPFASTDEANLFSSAAVFESKYPDIMVSLLKAQVPQGATVVVQDQRLVQQLEELGYKAEMNLLVFRVIRRYAAQMLKYQAEDSYQQARALAHSASRHVCQFDKNKSDQQVIQGIGYYETLIKDINSQAMRLIECVGFHFPELKRLVADLDLYILFAYHLKNRVYMTEHPLEEMLPKIDAAVKDLALDTKENVKQLLIKIYKSAPVSTGCGFEEPEFLQLSLLETKVYNLVVEKQNTFKFLESKLQLISPNILEVLGTLNTARLIAKAGSLSKLAKAPASTVQLYGAEKALFRVLKRKSNKTPKYGLLFRSSHVQACKHVKSRGRVARALACCVARCSRVDYYSVGETTGVEYGKAMKELMDQRVAYYDGTLKGEMKRMADCVAQFQK